MVDGQEEEGERKVGEKEAWEDEKNEGLKKYNKCLTGSIRLNKGTVFIAWENNRTNEDKEKLDEGKDTGGREGEKRPKMETIRTI